MNIELFKQVFSLTAHWKTSESLQQTSLYNFIWQTDIFHAVTWKLRNPFIAPFIMLIFFESFSWNRKTYDQKLVLSQKFTICNEFFSIVSFSVLSYSFQVDTALRPWKWLKIWKVKHTFFANLANELLLKELFSLIINMQNTLDFVILLWILLLILNNFYLPARNEVSYQVQSELM